MRIYFVGALICDFVCYCREFFQFSTVCGCARTKLRSWYPLVLPGFPCTRVAGRADTGNKPWRLAPPMQRKTHGRPLWLVLGLLVVCGHCVAADGRSRSSSGIARHALWHDVHHVWAASSASLSYLAREVIGEWSTRMLLYREHLSADGSNKGWRQRAIHREAGRVLKFLIQISAVAYFVQRRTAGCLTCGKKWTQCM